MEVEVERARIEEIEKVRVYEVEVARRVVEDEDVVVV